MNLSCWLLCARDIPYMFHTYPCEVNTIIHIFIDKERGSERLRHFPQDSTDVGGRTSVLNLVKWNLQYKVGKAQTLGFISGSAHNRYVTWDAWRCPFPYHKIGGRTAPTSGCYKNWMSGRCKRPALKRYIIIFVTFPSSQVSWRQRPHLSYYLLFSFILNTFSI